MKSSGHDHEEQTAQADNQGQNGADKAEDEAKYRLAGLLGLGGGNEADDAEDDARDEKPAENDTENTHGLAALLAAGKSVGGHLFPP